MRSRLSGSIEVYDINISVIYKKIGDLIPIPERSGEATENTSLQPLEVIVEANIHANHFIYEHFVLSCFSLLTITDT